MPKNVHSKEKPPNLPQAELNEAEIRKKLEIEAQKNPLPKLWEPWEDQLIRDFSGTVSVPAIARELKRSRQSVDHRRSVLGLTGKRGSPP